MWVEVLSIAPKVASHMRLNQCGVVSWISSKRWLSPSPYTESFGNSTWISRRFAVKMVFKRGVALLAIAAAAALVSTEAAPIQVHTDLKNPVVKSVKSDHGKLILTLQEGSTVKKAAPKHAKHHDEKKKHHAVKHTDVKKIDVKKPTAVKVEAKKDQNKKHPAAKKSVAKKTAPQVETKADGEIIKRYAHGEVRVIAKNQPAAKTDAHKKHAKKVAKKQVEEVAVDDSADESADVDLKVGEAVTIEFANHTVYLELLKNGSVSLTADSVTHMLPKAESIELEIDEEDSEESEEAASTAGSSSHSSPPAEVGLLEKAENEASLVAKKFTELATKLTGDGKFFSKEAAPVIFIGGCIGALAAIVGIAAIAIGRSRDNAAAADPSSVLADATEDVEADVEAGAASTAEESSEDAAADETQSLSSSDSESDAEEDSEEGKFTNEVASV